MATDLLYSTSKDELKEIIKNAVSDTLKLHLSNQTENNKYPEYLELKEACKYLHLAKPTVYGFTSKKEIPFIKKGKKLYFKKIDLDQWLINKK